ncbi:Uncharacterized protein ALO87_03937 [Pseudomonas syringae pv. apii]|uniref:hypothetical protein n=1 Tax=Pseudomonas syringae group genomosp. 3 TaxID=251701 RepID=UPI0006E6C851|nr:hypothetical protein [Pseudomonas syringae group genomosp. 3]KPW32507.1 Uncharacterized protein ALO87_03937 [Pseudomonas syringae pv. apii]
MKIRAVWGFVGNAALLNAESGRVKRGDVFDDADDEYGHTLVGKGLVQELGADGKPKVTKAKESKQAKPDENK